MPLQKRTPKFRVWNVKTKRFAPSKNKWGEPHDNEVYSQFTGILDMNGREIYEGDFLSSIKDSGEFKPIDLVVFSEKHHGWRRKSKDGFEHLFPTENKMFYTEVIGNEFETPDLVK